MAKRLGLIVVLFLAACGVSNNQTLETQQTSNPTIGLYPETNTCNEATNVGDLCLVAISLRGNDKPFGFIGIAFELANPSFELVSARKANQNSLLAISAREGDSTRSVIAMLTLSGELFGPGQNGRVVDVVFRRVSPSRNMFVLSDVYLGASTAYVGASDVVLERNLAF